MVCGMGKGILILEGKKNPNTGSSIGHLGRYGINKRARGYRAFKLKTTSFFFRGVLFIARVEAEKLNK